MPDRQPKPARLVLSDGTVFSGTSFGSPLTVDGEVVFNTG
ncbi:MAG: carbamoyl-phosphate synthase domain-containing protein, partial [Elusimicrobia bacterium]|nr:carbamoyl-phosphate synthase domain-containing protein [Elusimicrobiota bacterium]